MVHRYFIVGGTVNVAKDTPNPSLDTELAENEIGAEVSSRSAARLE